MPRVRRAVVLACFLAVFPARVRATCNVIPSVDRTFPSALGEVSRPFARPGDAVAISRAELVFADDPSANAVFVTFQPLEAEPMRVGPLPGTPCAPERCVARRCACVEFDFPDTDAALAPPGDGHPLTGPAVITVVTGATEVARIDRLLLPGSRFHDDLFPGFLALPPANRFDRLVERAGPVLGARDVAGNLFIPVDVSALVPTDARRARFLDAVIAGVADAPMAIDVFTAAGQRLPPLIRDVGAGTLVGTADAPDSILRIRKGALRPGLGPELGVGPVVLGSVRTSAPDSGRADPVTMAVNERFAVFENRECGPQDEPADCLDVNGDGDTSDYLLQALDLSHSGAEPVTIDEVDVADFPKERVFPPFSLYSFSATDAVVAYRIVETTAEGLEQPVDVNGNGIVGELVRSGAFDLIRGVPIVEAADSPRQEVAGALLAFTRPGESPGGPDPLFLYDAAREPPGPFPVRDAGHARFLVTRTPIGQFSAPLVFPMVSFARRTYPVDLAVNGRQVAFVVPEAADGEDLTADGDLDDLALLVVDAATGQVTNPRQAIAPQPDLARLAMSGRWLVYQAARPGGLFGTVFGAAVLDLANPGLPPALFCADDGLGFVVPSLSDALIPCVRGERTRDLNGDGDRGDANVLSVVTPGAGGVLREQNLGLAVLSSLDPQVQRDVVAVGVDEAKQGRDLDGDGVVGRTAGPYVLHTFDRNTGRITNFGARVAASSEPLLQFVRKGLITLSAPPRFVRRIFRDVDEDGVFEEPVPPTGVLADDCPTVPNPFQEDADGDGVGDLCECPILAVETVQAFAGSRVRVPVDLDPGVNAVASLNFTVSYHEGWESGAVGGPVCVDGPIARDVRAELSCSPRQPPGEVIAAALNAPVFPVPVLGAGELMSLELDVARGTAGQTVRVCIPQPSVRIGDATGPDLCAGETVCGEIRVHPDCTLQGDCNCDGHVNAGDRVCLVTKFFDPTQQGTCPCEDCNLSGELNAADAPCMTLCAFGQCATGRLEGE